MSNQLNPERMRLVTDVRPASPAPVVAAPAVPAVVPAAPEAPPPVVPAPVAESPAPPGCVAFGVVSGVQLDEINARHPSRSDKLRSFIDSSGN